MNKKGTEDLVSSWSNSRQKIIPSALEISPYTNPTIIRRVTPLSVPNNSPTIIPFTELRVQGDLAYDGNSAILLPGGTYVISVIGGYEFPVNANGVRAINFNFYDDSDVYITGTALSEFKSNGLDWDEIPVAYHGVVLNPAAYAPQIPTKLKFTIYQNSGGALNLTWCQLSVSIVPTKTK